MAQRLPRRPRIREQDWAPPFGGLVARGGSSVATGPVNMGAEI